MILIAHNKLFTYVMAAVIMPVAYVTSTGAGTVCSWGRRNP